MIKINLQKFCINEEKSIKETMNQIDQGSIGIAFILDSNNQYIGVATDGDIRRALLQGISLDEPIKSIINKNSLSIESTWNENTIKQLLKQSEYKNRVPIQGTIKIPVLNKQKQVIDIIFASQKECESYNTIMATQNKQHKKQVQKILVVGGAGYLGSVLCKKLLKKGYQVRVLDTLMYGDHGIHNLYNNKNFECLQGDFRNIQIVVDAVKNMDAVIHLAAIVGDPASAIDPEETIEINYLGTKLIAEVCKYSQINRFIFASTCSVYGASKKPNDFISETSELNPVSLYAKMKLKSEQGILELEDENFSPTILRMATLFGLSERMRFDLVVNILTIKALTEKKYTIFGGDQWRPNLHVADAADAYIKCIEKPIENIKGEIFNVGSNRENHKIQELGDLVKTIIPDSQMIIDKQNLDKRNYRVNFDKIENILDYHPQNSVEDGIQEIKNVFETGLFSDYLNEIYSNYKYIEQYGFH